MRRHRWGGPTSHLWLFLLFARKILIHIPCFSAFFLSFFLSFLLSSFGSMELIFTRLSTAFVSNPQSGHMEKKTAMEGYIYIYKVFTLLLRRMHFVLTLPGFFWTRTKRLCGHIRIRFCLVGLDGGCWEAGQPSAHRINSAPKTFFTSLNDNTPWEAWPLTGEKKKIVV